MEDKYPCLLWETDSILNASIIISWDALKKAKRTIKIAVANRFFCGSLNEVSNKDRIIKIWTNKSQLRLCPNFLKIGKLNLSIIGDQRYLKAYAKPAQLNRVIVLLSIPALDNQTDKVENTNNIGNPEEKPNKSIFNDFSLKK